MQRPTAVNMPAALVRSTLRVVIGGGLAMLVTAIVGQLVHVSGVWQAGYRKYAKDFGALAASTGFERLSRQMPRRRTVPG
jgi:hypothetical protein